MPKLDPRFEIGGKFGDSQVASFARACYQRGFSGSAAQSIVLRSGSKSQFELNLAEACSIRAIARIAAPGMPDDFDTEAAVTDAVCKATPLEAVRADIIEAMAELSNSERIDTSARLSTPVQREHADVYAARAAQMSRRGRK